MVGKFPIKINTMRYRQVGQAGCYNGLFTGVESIATLPGRDSKTNWDESHRIMWEVFSRPKEVD